jgi:hypothetical protein
MPLEHEGFAMNPFSRSREKVREAGMRGRW